MQKWEDMMDYFDYEIDFADSIEFEADLAARFDNIAAANASVSDIALSPDGTADIWNDFSDFSAAVPQKAALDVVFNGGDEDEVVSEGTRDNSYSGGSTFFGTGGGDSMFDVESPNPLDEVIVTAQIMPQDNSVAEAFEGRIQILTLRGSDAVMGYIFDGKNYGLDKESWVEDIFDAVVEESLNSLDGTGGDHALEFVGILTLFQAIFDALSVEQQVFILEFFGGLDLGS